MSVTIKASTQGLNDMKCRINYIVYIYQAVFGHGKSIVTSPGYMEGEVVYTQANKLTYDLQWYIYYTPKYYTSGAWDIL